MKKGKQVKPAEALRSLTEFLPYFPRSLRMVWDAAGWYTVVWFILSSLSGAFAPVIITLTRNVINLGTQALEEGTFDPITIARQAIPLALVFLLQMLVGYITSWLNMIQTEYAKDHVTEMIQRKAIALDLAHFEVPEYYNMLHLARTDASNRPLQIVQSGATFISTIIKMSGIVVILISFSSWVLPLVFLSSLPIFAALMRYNRMMFRWTRGNAPDQRKANYYDQLITDLDAAAEIRMFTLGPYYHQKYVDIRRRIRSERFTLEKKRIVLNALGIIVSFGVTGFALGWMAWRVWLGESTVGDLVAFYQVLKQGEGAIKGLQGKVGSTANNLLSLKYLFDFLDLESKMKDEPTRPMISLPLNTGIRFENLGFTYPGSDRPALANFNWTIPAGKMVALVGENGTGKSTLVKLLCRLYDPDEGRVLWDETDLRELPLEEVRRQVLILFQHPYHYFDTAERIIGLGDTNHQLNRERIEWSARLAHAQELIDRLPRGYKTILGKRFGGEELSSGQWQRLALARSFYHDKSIVLLDEPTSAIDSWTENMWVNHLREQARDRTLLLITHRLSTARIADWIAVLHDNRIVEEGTHQELLALRGRYASAWEKQGYADEMEEITSED